MNSIPTRDFVSSMVSRIEKRLTHARHKAEFEVSSTNPTFNPSCYFCCPTCTNSNKLQKAFIATTKEHYLIINKHLTFHRIFPNADSKIYSIKCVLLYIHCQIPCEIDFSVTLHRQKVEYAHIFYLVGIWLSYACHVFLLKKRNLTAPQTPRHQHTAALVTEIVNKNNQNTCWHKS